MNQLLIPERLFVGEQSAKQEALNRVLSNAGDDWRIAAINIVREMSGDVTGEDIRLACERAGVRPHHHNAWGGFVASLIGELLVPTGRYVAMQAKGSHGRKTQVYRII